MSTTPQDECPCEFPAGSQNCPPGHKEAYEKFHAEGDTVPQDELEQILLDSASVICDEWCTKHHSDAEVVDNHMAEEKAAILAYTHREQVRYGIERMRELKNDMESRMGPQPHENPYVFLDDINAAIEAEQKKLKEVS